MSLITPQPLTRVTQTSVSVLATSFTVLAANTARRSATVENNGAADVLLHFGATASSTDYMVTLAPGEYYEFDNPMYTGIVTAIGSSATGTLRVTQGI